MNVIGVSYPLIPHFRIITVSEFSLLANDYDEDKFGRDLVGLINSSMSDKKQPQYFKNLRTISIKISTSREWLLTIDADPIDIKMKDDITEKRLECIYSVIDYLRKNGAVTLLRTLCIYAFKDNFVLTKDQIINLLHRTINYNLSDNIIISVNLILYCTVTESNIILVGGVPLIERALIEMARTDDNRNSSPVPNFIFEEAKNRGIIDYKEDYKTYENEFTVAESAKQRVSTSATKVIKQNSTILLGKKFL